MIEALLGKRYQICGRRAVRAVLRWGIAAIGLFAIPVSVKKAVLHSWISRQLGGGFKWSVHKKSTLIEWSPLIPGKLLVPV
jgi:hypothetical protein